MKLPSRAIVYIFFGGWAVWLAPVQNAVAQVDSNSLEQPASLSRADWERRAVQSPQYDNQNAPSTAWTDNGAGPRATTNRANDGWTSVRGVSATEVVDPNATPAPAAPAPTVTRVAPSRDATPELLRPEPAMNTGPRPADTVINGQQPAPGYVSGGAAMDGTVFGDDQGSGGAQGGETYCEDGNCGGWFDGCHCGILQHASLFAGVQGFKGPLDQGANGNFGFHEGINFGGPVTNLLGGQLLREIGFQIGGSIVESDLSGSSPLGQVSSSNRDQLFLTGGLFHRAMCDGLQWGVVYDYEHDPYYTTQDYYQFRAELGLVHTGCYEIGVTASFGNNQQYSVEQLVGGVPTLVPNNAQPLQLYTGFLRKYFAEGGEARIWGGATNMGDGLIGAELHLPLAGSIALENSFQYMIPNNGGSAAGQARESWCLMAQLVWTPGRPARCVQNDAYNPLLPVADNGSFIIDRR